MSYIVPIFDISDEDAPAVGGKASAQARLKREGFPVPDALVVTVKAYEAYMNATGLRSRVLMELERKSFGDMRWEEMWDLALRIRRLFLAEPVPGPLESELRDAVDTAFGDRPVAVRSSAVGEDSAATSFAGLHESYVNIRGVDGILTHVRLVWASLFSDRALLYRRELGLNADTSVIAAMIQEMIAGDRSGIAFGESPTDPSRGVVEAVYGLNQALVDGTIEPDRWEIDRRDGRIVAHTPAERERLMVPTDKGVRIDALAPERRSAEPLTEAEVSEIWETCTRIEEIFGSPRDVEWTIRDRSLFVLQARPITARRSKDGDDQRQWYFGLRRSFDNLKSLRVRIERDLIPAMETEAEDIGRRDLAALSDDELAAEIARRRERVSAWERSYYEYCIPFAHGMRLFGEVYTDHVRPDDPFEFMDLLSGLDMESVQRNRLLEAAADMVRADPEQAARLEAGEAPDPDSLLGRALDEFAKRFGGQAWASAAFGDDTRALLDLVLTYARRKKSSPASTASNRAALEERFLDRFAGERRAEAEELLDLARASYRLRDDDNIFLGRIEGRLVEALNEGRRRLKRGDRRTSHSKSLRQAVGEEFDETGPAVDRSDGPSTPPSVAGFDVKARQIQGQPASRGIAVGRARVVRSQHDLFHFQEGEILVCDAIDPNMTFVVPLAAGIVERRGGMLIHGAIIAREYGVPCVTGVKNAAELISTGDIVTVDGFLGIVIIGEPTFRAQAVRTEAEAQLQD